MFMELGLFEFEFNIWERISQDRLGYAAVTTSQWLNPTKVYFFFGVHCASAWISQTIDPVWQLMLPGWGRYHHLGTYGLISHVAGKIEHRKLQVKSLVFSPGMDIGDFQSHFLDPANYMGRFRQLGKLNPPMWHWRRRNSWVWADLTSFPICLPLYVVIQDGY